MNKIVCNKLSKMVPILSIYDAINAAAILPPALSPAIIILLLLPPIKINK